MVDQVRISETNNTTKRRQLSYYERENKWIYILANAHKYNQVR